MWQQFIDIDRAFKTERDRRWLCGETLDGWRFDQQYKHLSAPGTSDGCAGMDREEFYAFKLSAQGWHDRTEQHLVDCLSHACGSGRASIYTVSLETQDIHLNVLVLIKANAAIHLYGHHPMNAVGVDVQVQAQDQAIVRCRNNFEVC